jgi:hypothetical protein
MDRAAHPHLPTATQYERSLAQFERQLVDAGVPEKRAKVAARLEYGYTNAKIADDLETTATNVRTLKSDCKRHIEDVREQVALLDESPIQPVDRAFIKQVQDRLDHTPAFSFHRPQETDDGLALAGGDVLEATYQHDSNLYVLEYSTNTASYRGATTETYLLDPSDLVAFAVDWLVSGRFDADGRTEGTTREWFLTDAFDIDHALDELEMRGVTRVSVLTDRAFVNPLEQDSEHVIVESSARTGQYPNGFKVAYRPTDEEVQQAVDDGAISSETAAALTP